MVAIAIVVVVVIVVALVLVIDAVEVVVFVVVRLLQGIVCEAPSVLSAKLFLANAWNTRARASSSDKDVGKRC